MSARKFTMQQVTDRVLDSDFDPGEATQESQDEGDTSTHESQDEGDTSADTNILARGENTDYVDRVIKKDAAVRVKACQRGCGDRDSNSSFDHSSEFEKDKTSPPQTLQELRGKKRAHSMSPPAHASANATAESPVPGPSLMQTSTPNSPSAVTAMFGSRSRSPASLDDTIEGYVDLGDLSDSDMIIMGEQPMPQDVTSGDDSDTMDTEDFNRCMRSQTQDDAGADADDEDDAPDAQDRGRQWFIYGESFDSDQEGQEGDAERDGVDHPDNEPDNDADPPPPCPPNTGTRRYKEAGPCIQEPIKNFVDTDYPEDVGIWKPTATYPVGNVKRHDLVFTRSPASDRADGLLFDPTGMSPLEFFYKMWPRDLFDHISAETNHHYDRCATEGHNNRFSEFDQFIDNSSQMGTHLCTLLFVALRFSWASQGLLHKNISTTACRCNLVPFVSLSCSHFGSHSGVWSVSFKMIVSHSLSNNHIQ